jgi:hypothetical protein
MEFNNTNDFFEMVATGSVANIDVKQYVKHITDNHNLDFLKSLQFDLGVFFAMHREELEDNITDKDWEEKIEYYKQKGEEIPVIKFENFERKINIRKGLPFEHLPEFEYSYDLEKIFYPYDLFSLRQLEFYIKNLINENENPQTTKPNKPNKSLLFEGKNLNLSERYKIANKVINIEKQIRTLNIKELEKHQLLAFILGCDITNARNLYNGTYNSKDRDLSNYFNELGLNE